jgi:hypothetical protein
MQRKEKSSRQSYRLFVSLRLVQPLNSASCIHKRCAISRLRQYDDLITFIMLAVIFVCHDKRMMTTFHGKAQNTRREENERTRQ